MNKRQRKKFKAKHGYKKCGYNYRRWIHDHVDEYLGSVSDNSLLEHDPFSFTSYQAEARQRELRYGGMLGKLMGEMINMGRNYE